MGQLFLGFRSLLLKLAVFVVMAALLAWVLGGTLFPRPQLARSQPVSLAGQQWSWQLAVGGKNEGEVRWQLMRKPQQGNEEPVATASAWLDRADLIAVHGALYFGAFSAAEGWRLGRIDTRGEIELYPMPDRLAVEQQLARVAAGLPVQDAQEIENQRPIVLDPKAVRADKN